MPLKGDSIVRGSYEKLMKSYHCSQLFLRRRCLMPVSPSLSSAAVFRTVPFGLGFKSLCQVPRQGLHPHSVPVSSLMWGWGAGPPSLINLSLEVMGCGHHLGQPLANESWRQWVHTPASCPSGGQPEMPCMLPRCPVRLSRKTKLKSSCCLEIS